MKLKQLNFPIKDVVLNSEGKLTKVWMDEFINLQIVLNEIIKKHNTP
jgi:hypothetical protein